MTLKQCDVREATHVVTLTSDGRVTEEIASKWGIDENGRLAKPKHGGFGVITVSGRRIGMKEAWSYWKVT